MAEAEFGPPELPSTEEPVVEESAPAEATPVPVRAVLHTGEGDRKDRELVVEDPGTDDLPECPWLSREELLALRGKAHVMWTSEPEVR